MPSSIHSSRSRLTSLALVGGLAAAPLQAQPPSLPEDAPVVQPAAASRPAQVPEPAPTPATPPPDPERIARTATELGQKAYDLGRFEEAIRHYSAAYQTMPLPALLFNLGQCHRQLGQFGQAAFFYGRYLDLVPKAPNAALTHELLEEVGAARVARASPDTPVPLHKNWWFWAGASAAAVLAGSAVYFATRPPSPTLGTLDGR